MLGFLPVLERVLAYAVPFGALAAAWRSWRQRLSSRYRWFSAGGGLWRRLPACSLPLIAVPPAYFWSFVGYQIVLWILELLVLLELFSILLDNYRGIASAGRDFMRIALAAAVLITLLIALLNHQSGPGEFPMLESFLLVSRVVLFLILGFLALMIVFLLWFPMLLMRIRSGLPYGVFGVLCRAGAE